jgi:hypothetical protein
LERATLPPPADLTVSIIPTTVTSNLVAKLRGLTNGAGQPEEVESWDAVFLPVEQRKNAEATYDMLAVIMSIKLFFFVLNFF